jgi:hypothetical protein
MGFVSFAAVGRAGFGSALAAAVVGGLAFSAAPAAETFPSVRPVGRAQAALVLTGSGAPAPA